MKLLVAVAAVAVVLVVFVVAMRRRHSDEAHSVAGYRRTLDTLAGIGSERSSGPAGAVGPRREHTGSAGPAGVTLEGPPAGSPSPARDPEPVRRWPSDDGPGRAWPGARGRGIGRAVPRAGRGRRFRIAVTLATTAVVVVIVAVVLVGGHHPGSNGSAAATGGAAGSTAGGAPARGPDGTTTTLPAHEEPVSSTANTATYTPPTAAYAVTLAATNGSCWVKVTDAAGTVVLAETIPAGTRHSLTLNGKATVLLGAPTVITVSVDRVPAVLPSGYRSPFTMTFAPSSAGQRQ